MAKSSRASSVKSNNQRLKAKVFSPVEEERNARLSAKLLELAAQPKPERPAEEMKDVEEGDQADEEKNPDDDNTAMDLDTAKAAAAAVASKRSHKKRMEKKRKTSKIVFPRYKDRVTKRRKN
ncbi:hypothetical protein F5X96DRAFT_635267 [Biscogniauxia mediterranea]|nr:hypothetical protein F5X96DRAFT_635267 [Biscogniauxia mediterranea]